MAECCDPITPPACIKKCPTLVDACCVINQENLPCLFPPIEAVGSGTISQFTISVPIPTGIVKGMSVTGTGVGENALVTNVSATIITVDVANAATFTSGDLVFSLINHKQCDINELVSIAICALQLGTVPCSTHTAATLESPWVNLGTPWQTVEYSDVVNCTVKLRGTAVRILSDICYSIGSGTASTIFTLPSGYRPSARLVFSVNLLRKEGGAECLIRGGLVTIDNTGEVRLSFDNSGQTGIAWSVSLDGISFDVASI